MREFVELAKGLGCDCVNFSKLVNWGTYSEQEYRERTIVDFSGHIKHIKEKYKNCFKKIEGGGKTKVVFTNFSGNIDYMQDEKEFLYITYPVNFYEI